MSHDTPERRFFASTLASYGSLFVRLLLRFGTRLILARLVLADPQGLYESALRIVTIAGAVRDLGLPFHLMRDERRPYGTVLAMTTLSGLTVTVLLLLASPVFAIFDDRLPFVVRVFAPLILLDGLASIPKTYFDREMRVGRVVAPEIARGVATALVSVVLAFLGWGVWSFVAADLAAAAVFAGWVWARARGEIPLAVRWEWAPELLRKSAFLFAIWIVLYLVTYIDAFIIGFFENQAAVGYYARAYELAFLVATIISPRALLPALIEYRDDPNRFAEVARISTVLLLAFQVPASYFLFVNAETVVRILYGPDWAPCAPLLRVLALVPLLDVFTKIAGEVLKARHEDRRWLVIAGVNLTSLLGFGIAFTLRWGALGMAAANFLLLGNVLMATRMASIFRGRLVPLLRDLAWVYILPLPFFAAASLLGLGTWLCFAASVAGAAVIAVLQWRRWRGAMEEFLRGRKQTAAS